MLHKVVMADSSASSVFRRHDGRPPRNRPSTRRQTPVASRYPHVRLPARDAILHPGNRSGHDIPGSGDAAWSMDSDGAIRSPCGRTTRWTEEAFVNTRPAFPIHVPADQPSNGAGCRKRVMPMNISDPETRIPPERRALAGLLLPLQVAGIISVPSSDSLSEIRHAQSSRRRRKTIHPSTRQHRDRDSRRPLPSRNGSTLFSTEDKASPR